jgi:hypothetical protein
MYDNASYRRPNTQARYPVSVIIDHYRTWVNDTRYMILSRKTDAGNETYAVKCAKRGNDVYRYRVSRRFSGLYPIAENLSFFNPRDLGGNKKTRALWVTLTYDLKRCTHTKAWYGIGKEFNRFMAYLRRLYGKVSTCRVFEAFENGYPHVHCILFFESKWFNVFRDKKGQFRTHSKPIIGKGWHSNIDVKAMSSLGGGFSYLRKYLLKSTDAENTDSKGLKTLALCWAFRKRAFSVSGRFRETLSEAANKANNTDAATSSLGRQHEEKTVRVMGFIPSDILYLKSFEWFKKLDDNQAEIVGTYLDELWEPGGREG